MACCCKSGASAAGADETQVHLMGEYGLNLGLAFQMKDDILDFTGTEAQLGKPAGSDLLQGNVTLPALFAMEDKHARERITAVHPKTTPNEMKEIIALIKETGAIEKSYELSDRYLQKAFRILETLPNNKARSTLYDIAKYIGKRDY